jgi:hypothetical protein
MEAPVSGEFTGSCFCGAVRFSVAGEVRRFGNSPAARRGCCLVFRSNLFCRRAASVLSLMAGTFDADPGTCLAGHVYCADKRACDTIGVGLPHAAADDPALIDQVRN